jgi:purine-nucleoside phosphorylase
LIKEKTLTTMFTEVKKYLEDKIPYKPTMGVILGSGLGSFAEIVEDKIIFDYQNIPHFPQSTVKGHSGRLVVGKIASQEVMVLQGRFHYYEGYEMNYVTFPVRAMQAMGVKNLIVTNAAGGINPEYQPGDLVLIKDHINLMGANPLRGANISSLGPRFPDLSEAYHKEWRQKGLAIMKELGLNPREGVYAAVSGPSYETPAEIQFLKTIGADLVGMSTVPEVIVAKHGGMNVLGISCVTNYAAGISKQKLNHAEVIAVAEKIEKTFVRTLSELIKVMA